MVRDRTGRPTGQLRQTFIGEASFLQAKHIKTGFRQAIGADIFFNRHDLFDLPQEPTINLAGFVDFFDLQTVAESLRHEQDTVRDRFAQCGEDIGLIRHAVNFSTLDLDLVHTGPTSLHRTQRLLKTFLECSANRHRFADGLHRRCQGRFRARELLESEPGHLRHDIVDCWLKTRRRDLRDIVVEFVECIAHRKFCRDLGDRKSGCL